MNKPIKKYKSGSFEGAVWSNKRKVEETEVEFKTISLRKAWKDDKNLWRDSTINLRRNDIPRVMLILQKIHEELLLEDKGGENE